MLVHIFMSRFIFPFQTQIYSFKTCTNIVLFSMLALLDLNHQFPRSMLRSFCQAPSAFDMKNIQTMSCPLGSHVT